MKKSKIAVLLIAVFLILAACSQGATEEIVPEYENKVEEADIDLLGYVYTIAAETHGGGEYQLSPDPGSSDRGDRLLQRYKDTEQKFNVKMDIQDGSSLSMFLTQYAAGMKYADLMISKIADVFNGKYVQNGYISRNHHHCTRHAIHTLDSSHHSKYDNRSCKDFPRHRGDVR